MCSSACCISVSTSGLHLSLRARMQCGTGSQGQGCWTDTHGKSTRAIDCRARSTNNKPEAVRLA
jgi:hypothetical protein